MEENRNGEENEVSGELKQTPARKIKKVRSKKDSDTEKSRNPSGQIISTSVKDIRNFFISEPQIVPKVKRSKVSLDYKDSEIQSSRSGSSHPRSHKNHSTMSAISNWCQTSYNSANRGCVNECDWQFVNKQHKRKSVNKQRQLQSDVFKPPDYLSNRFAQLASTSDLSSIDSIDCLIHT